MASDYGSVGTGDILMLIREDFNKEVILGTSSFNVFLIHLTSVSFFDFKLKQMLFGLVWNLKKQRGLFLV